MEKDRINAQGDPDGPDSSSSFSSSASVWYFAYGSNMRASVMTGRGLHIAATQAVVLPSHMLTFDIFGIPYTEPAMASISPRPRPHSGIQNRCGIPLEQAPDVHGAAYLLSKSDFTKLVLSEGAGTAYREIEVEALVLPPPGNVTDTSEVTVEVTSASTSIRAKTLVARYPFRPNAAPSARYLVSLCIVYGSRPYLPNLNPTRCKWGSECLFITIILACGYDYDYVHVYVYSS
jgi:hypothetical protein